MAKRLIALLFLAALMHGAPAWAQSGPGNAVASVQSAVDESSHVLKSTGGWLYGFSATSDGGTAGYVLIYDASAVPGDGAVTPRFCYYLPATQTTGASWVQYPVPFTNGIVISFSSTGCFTKATSPTGFFSAQVK